MTPPAHREPANGVYAAPGDLAGLRGRYSSSRAIWRRIELGAVNDKTGLLHALAAALDFPADFGRNWDALADSLEDLSWLPRVALVLEIAGSEGLRRDAPDAWRTALDILRAAATYWASHDRKMLVLVHGAADLPECRA